MDASQIEVFEKCPRSWFYSYVLNLTPKQSHRAFNIGSYYHEVLARFYSLPLEIPNIAFNERLKQTLNFAQEDDLFRKFNIKSLEDMRFHRKRLLDYFYKWAEEDEQIESIAVEKGFSTLLYEDSTRRYILEGKIDLVGDGKPYGMFVMDHKTQSRKDDRWEFNHQVCNYMSFTGANYFIYNYIGLQDKLPIDGMRRMIYKPAPGMLDQWKSEVIKTFREMELHLRYYEQNKEMEEFPRRRSACDASKYGLCQYHKLCSVPDDSKFKPAVFSAYKPKDEIWRAWS